MHTASKMALSAIHCAASFVRENETTRIRKHICRRTEYLTFLITCSKFRCAKHSLFWADWQSISGTKISLLVAVFVASCSPVLRASSVNGITHIFAQCSPLSSPAVASVCEFYCQEKFMSCLFSFNPSSDK